MALGPLAPVARQRVFSGLGVVLPGALLTTYAAGTTTPLTTYNDEDLAIGHENTNPIVADSGGLFGPIYLSPGVAYKFVLTTSAGAAVWSQDYVLDATDLVTPVSGGGTGAATFTAHGVLLGEGTSPIAATSAGTTGQVLTSNGASADPTFQAAQGDFAVCRGRLTLTTAVPVTTADVTGATNVFFTPYLGNTLGLYDGSTTWTVLTFTEKTLALGTLTNDLPYDVFAYNNSGVVALEALAWTNKTTRATALVLQDGVLSKTGALTRRYLGTFHTTATTTTEDSEAKRLVWNYYNRVPRSMRRQEATGNWTYTTKTWRQANAAVANQLAFVIGVAEIAIQAALTVEVTNGGTAANVSVSLGLDSTTAPTTGALSTALAITTAGVINSVNALYSGIPAAGYHFLAWLEISSASNTTTWRSNNDQTFSEQSGLVGSLLA